MHKKGKDNKKKPEKQNKTLGEITKRKLRLQKDNKDNKKITKITKITNREQR